MPSKTFFLGSLQRRAGGSAEPSTIRRHEPPKTNSPARRVLARHDVAPAEHSVFTFAMRYDHRLIFYGT
jgi:hypothetical protein